MSFELTLWHLIFLLAGLIFGMILGLALAKRSSTSVPQVDPVELMQRASDQQLTQTQAMLSPLHSTLQNLQDLVHRTESERKTAAAQLAFQIEHVKETGELIHANAHELVATMRNPKSRGSWGELQLRRVVEAAGMIKHCHFIEQFTSQGESNNRPDLVVLLGEDRCIYVDAKFPLDSFTKAVNAETDRDRQHYLGEFKSRILATITQLSTKNYWQDASENGLVTPEFVVMYLPAEGVLAEAYELIPDLFERAAKAHLVLATPATLLALLRAVSFSLNQTNLNERAAEIAALGEKLFKQLNTFSGHLAKVGKGLNSAVSAYNAAVGSFIRNSYRSAEKLADLGGYPGELPALSALDDAADSSRISVTSK